MPSQPSPMEKTIRAAGALVRVTPETLLELFTNDPIDFVIEGPRYLLRTMPDGSGIFKLGWRYLAVSRGVVFFVQSKQRIELPASIRKIDAQDVFISFLGSDRLSL
jgi:hypothetical protein